MFRFTIRDVLWLTVVVAMGTLWWLDRNQMQVEHTKAEAERTQAAEREAILAKGKIRAERRAEQVLNAMLERDELEIEAAQLQLQRASQTWDYMPAEPGEWQRQGKPTPR